MLIELNSLESARFGVVAARVCDPSASPQALNVAAQALGVQMLVARTACGEHAQIHSMEADGFRLMDTIVYYERSLNTPFASLPPSDVIIRRARPEDAAAVADVARAAFSDYIGHFHADPRLERAAADAAYVEWAESSVMGQTDRDQAKVLICEGRIGGFLTLRHNSVSELEIVLNAIHPDLQRRGFYQRLLEDALLTGRTSGADTMIISTQVNNVPVQRAWAVMGFSLTKSLHTFHKWYS